MIFIDEASSIDPKEWESTMKLLTEAQKRRMKIYRHNSFLGHTAMAISNMRGIQQSDTATQEAKQTAAHIEKLASVLAVQLKERRDA